MNIQEELAYERNLEARKDAEYEHKMRTDWEFALEQLDQGQCSIETAAKTLKLVSKKLNDLGWAINPQELLDIY